MQTVNPGNGCVKNKKGANNISGFKHQLCTLGMQTVSPGIVNNGRTHEITVRVLVATNGT